MFKFYLLMLAGLASAQSQFFPFGELPQNATIPVNPVSSSLQIPEGTYDLTSRNCKNFILDSCSNLCVATITLKNSGASTVITMAYAGSCPCSSSASTVDNYPAGSITQSGNTFTTSGYDSSGNGCAFTYTKRALGVNKGNNAAISLSLMAVAAIISIA